MQLGSGLSSQKDIACRYHILHGIGDSLQMLFPGKAVLVYASSVYQCGILAVIQKRQMKLRGNFHRFPAEPGIHDRTAVLADRRNPMRSHSPNIRKLLALQSPGDRACLQNMDRRGMLRLVPHIIHAVRRINGRSRVRHGHNSGKSPCGGRPGSAGDILLPGLSGIPQVHMHVYQSGHDIAAGGVQNLHLFTFFSRRAVRRLRDHSVPQKKIADLISSGCRVQNPSVFY